MAGIIDTQELEYSVDFDSQLSSQSSEVEYIRTEISEINDESEERNRDIDTQDLEYSHNFSSDSSSESDSSGNEEEFEIPDLKTLKPYDFEPLVKDITSIQNDQNCKAASKAETKRKGTKTWCQCGYCEAMESEAESLCCLDTNEVPCDYFEGKKCIALTEGFKDVCLKKNVLKTALSALNNLRGDALAKVVTNRSFRYAGYKQFTWWVFNYLGKGNRRVIPSCALWKIRSCFPDPNAEYVNYSEGKKD